MASTGGRHGSTNQCLSIHNPELLVVEITTTLNQSSAAVSECTEKYNYTVSQKNKQNYFFYNYVKLPPNPTIFGTKMAAK